MNIELGALANKDRAYQASNSIGPVELLFSFVGAVAAVLVCILSFNLMALFTPVRVAILAGAVVIILARICRVPIVWGDRRLSPWLGIAVVASVFLASHLAPHYFANQDEGYYTAMAEMMARGEPIDFVDHFVGSLPPDLQKVYYDETEMDVSWLKPGVAYIIFYPLHPAFMALARQLLGPGWHTAELLVAFAIVIVAIYLLTYELSGGDRRWAGFAAILAAINPALVFFAKFPVTELNAAAMMMPAGYHLLVGFRARAIALSIFHGVVAVLLILGYCFTRMSFPVIAPFLICITVLGFVIPEVQKRQKIFLLAMLCSALAAFAASLVFYHSRQPELLSDIIMAAYLPALRHLRWLVALAAAIGLAAIIALAVARWRPPAVAAARWVVNFIATWILPYPGLAIGILAIPTLYTLVKSGSFPAFDFEQPPGLQLVRFHALYVLMLFVSPFLFALLLAGVRLPRDDGGRAELLPSLWLILCWTVILGHAPIIRYLYYYGRYVTLEILPIAIIAIALAARWSLLPAPVVRALAVLGLAWSFAFSIVQIGHADGEVDKPFHRIAARLHGGDVLALDWDSAGSSATTVPLRYALGLSTINLTDKPKTEKPALLAKLQGAAEGRVYLLSTFDPTKDPTYAGVGLEPLDRIGRFLETMDLSDDLAGLGKWLLPSVVNHWEARTLYLSRTIPLRPTGDEGQPAR